MPRFPRPLLILFAGVLLVMLGGGLTGPVLPYYVAAFGGAGKSYGLLLTTFSLAGFLAAPVWGGLSDAWGRRPLLIAGMIGAGIGYAGMGLAANLGQLFVARAVGGLLSAATLPAAMAYASDVTTPSERGGGLGLISATLGLGMLTGPLVSRSVAEDALRAPFFGAAALCWLAAVVVRLLLPESLRPEQRSGQAGGVRMPALAATWRMLRSPVGFVLVLAFLYSFSFADYDGILGLYLVGQFGYDPKQLGALLMINGLAGGITMGLLAGPATRRWGEARVVRAMLLATFLAFAALASARTLPALLAAMLFFVFTNGLLRPALAALASRNAENQGAVMGSLSTAMGLGGIAGPAWAGFAFDLNPAYPFVTGALVRLSGGLAAMAWLRRRGKEREGVPEEVLTGAAPRV